MISFNTMDEELEVGEGVQHQTKNEGYSLHPEFPKTLKPPEIHTAYSHIPQDKNVVEASEQQL